MLGLVDVVGAGLISPLFDTAIGVADVVRRTDGVVDVLGADLISAVDSTTT